MTDFLKNLLDSMSTAFNSDPTPADGDRLVELNLSNDKTLKWRGLHNNQNPRKHPKKTPITVVNEVARLEERLLEQEKVSPSPSPPSSSSPHRHQQQKTNENKKTTSGSSMAATSTAANADKADDKVIGNAIKVKEQKLKKQNSNKILNKRNTKGGKNVIVKKTSRRLRKTRNEKMHDDVNVTVVADSATKSASDDKPPPQKRRGRAKKNSNDNIAQKNHIENATIKRNQSTETTENDQPVRKLRRSERNASLEVKTEVDDATTVIAAAAAGGGVKMEKETIHKKQNEMENVQETEINDTPEKNITRRSVRLESKLDTTDENISKDRIQLSQKESNIPDEIKTNSNEIEKDTSPVLDGKVIEENVLNNKQIVNDKTPKKRGRRAKTQETPTKTEMKKPTRQTGKGTTENSSSSNQSPAKEKPTKRLITAASQRPLRRIKPTAKILENDELRYEFETKNIARMTACTDFTNDEDEVKSKKDEKVESTISNVDLITENEKKNENKKKRLQKISNNLNVDNIYPPNIAQKPCPDPETFLNEIKAARINLHKSPEDKKLNKKQQRKLNKQKEKHFEKLGLRRNIQNGSDSEEFSSDNEEFVPSKKLKVVGKTNVTLRVRNMKENGVIQKESEKMALRKKGKLSVDPEKDTKPPDDNVESHNDGVQKEIDEMMCFCQKPSKYYTPYTPETSFCCALDNIDNQKVGCCNTLTGELLNLLRPSGRVGFMILCDDHKKRFRAHNCCAGCGVFCTQGNFMLCQQKHFFHIECAEKIVQSTLDTGTNDGGGGAEDYKNPHILLKCPHCGLKTSESSSLITMKCQSLPVFFPSQKIALTQNKAAKMTVPEAGQASLSPTKGRKLSQIVDLDILIPESVMNVVVRESGNQISEFTSKDLFYSINNDDLERVAEIIASGYNITSEMQEFLNGTSLHLVAHFGTIQMAYLLLCRDSSEQFLNMMDKERRTALMCAVIGEKLDILKLFIQCGADLTIKGPDGMTCLHIAAKLGNSQAAQLIVETCKNSTNIMNFKQFLNSVDDGGWTAMVWAAENGKIDIVSLLLSNGADPNICDAENNNVLHWATLSGDLDTILVLLRANIDCNVQNVNGDTPLHIACRQQSTKICLTLIANGADLIVKNKATELPYDCIPDEESPCARAVGFNMQMRTFGPIGLRNKIICSDISNGRETHPVQVVRCYSPSKTDEIDEEVLTPDFRYITKSIFLHSAIQIDYRVSQMRICSCTDGCNTSKCQCSTISVQNWYTPEGRLNGEFNYEDPAMIFECNDVCGCNKLMCKNRVVQNGIRIPLQVYECEERSKGWGVRTMVPVPKGSFIAEYAGEVLTDMEADRRTDDSYFFDLGSSDHCIDANFYGNVSRFFNHSCYANIVPVRVYFEHQDFRFPRIAFFACRDISAGEELTFDYGDKFWAVKQKYFPCKCLSTSCRYSKLITA